MSSRVFRPVSPRSGWRRRGAGAAGTVLLGFALVVGIALMLTVLSWLGAGLSPVRADTDTNAQKVAVFEDATVGVDEVWDNVVVVGGDLLVEGTVKNVVVVVGGDVTLASTARVGERGRSGDTALVSVFGDVTIERGARVLGETVDVAGGSGDVTAGSVSDPFLRPWRTGAILNWVWSTIFLAVVAVIATAIAPRQVAVVSDRVRRHFFSSLGWGALGAIIVVPIVTVVLIVTIIGILLVIPWLFIGLPLLSLFGLVAVGAMVGRLFFRDAEMTRGRVMLAAVVGVIIINLARWIPVGGFIILGLLWLVGFGATYVAIWAWLRDRRRRRKGQIAIGQSGPSGPPPMVPPPPAPGTLPAWAPESLPPVPPAAASVPGLPEEPPRS